MWNSPEDRLVDHWAFLLRDPQQRQYSIQQLVYMKEIFPGMALSLSRYLGTLFILLQEVTDIYMLLMSSQLSWADSLRVSNASNAVLLLQCLATHPSMGIIFIAAAIPVYLFPLLRTQECDFHFEVMRFRSLEVISTLMQCEDLQVVRFLVASKILPYCVHCIKIGSEPSQKEATLIISGILDKDVGRDYCCIFSDRFFAINSALQRMVERHLGDASFPGWLARLISVIYLTFSTTDRACAELTRRFPTCLNDIRFITATLNDRFATVCRRQFVDNVCRGGGIHNTAAEEANLCSSDGQFTSLW